MSEEVRWSYQLLELPPTASSDEIKRAYWAKAKAWHPDLNDGSPIKLEKMIELNRARELLLTAA